MITFWLIIGTMTLVAMSFLAYPLLQPAPKKMISLDTLTKNAHLSRLRYLSYIIIFLLPIIALGLYWQLGASQRVAEYEKAQARSQEIQTEIEKLGSIKNIIATLKQKVTEHPDGRGWYLLGKLYLKTEQFEAAKQAFIKAKELGFKDGN